MSSKLKMKKRRSTCRKLSTLNFQLSTLVAIALFFAMPLKAQVTIGPKDTSSDNFYLMKINSTSDKTGGLRMPQLSADQIDGANGLTNQLLNLAPEDAAAAKGLVVFNTDTKCLQVWNGTDWISLCIPSCSTPPKLGTIDNDVCTNMYQAKLNGSLRVVVPAVPGVTSYVWTLPPNWAITDGFGTNKITVLVSGATGKCTISVAAANICGMVGPESSVDFAVLPASGPPLACPVM